jgi:MYXO-CTERM domain-containing protein
MLIAVVSVPAWAVQTPEHLHGEEGLLLNDGTQTRVARDSSWQMPEAASKSWDTFKNSPSIAEAFRTDPSAWKAIWDNSTSVPTRLFGKGIVAPGAMTSEAAAEAASRAFLAEHIELLAPGASLADFKVVSNHLGNDMRTVGFFQYKDGLQVLGGQVSFRFKNDRLFVIGSEALPHVHSQDVASTVNSQKAENIANAWIAKQTGSTVSASEVEGPFILPILRMGQAPQYETVVRVTVEAKSPVGKWEVFLDAKTGQAIAREQMLKFATSNIQLNTPERWPGGPLLERPAQVLPTRIDGTTRYTDENGDVEIGENESVTATLKVAGPYVNVRNEAGGDISLDQELVANESFVWDRSENEYDDAQLTAFQAATIAKNQAQVLAPQMRWLTDDPLNVYVNMEDGNCNAYSNGTDIHFYAGSNQCANTARLNDVVMHEFGHSFHAHAIIWGAGDFDGALSEGISDYWSATVSNDPGMGRGFFNSNSPLRHLDNRNYVWPDDIDSDTHQTGLIFGGAMWDLRKKLVEIMGAEDGRAYADRLLYAAMQRASDISVTYVEILAADDDDGDLTNGTTNFCTIVDAFALHGLADPEISGMMGRPTMENLKVSVTTSTSQCPGMGLTNARVIWRWEGEDREEGAALVGEGNVLEAQIPAAALGQVVYFKVEAEQENGTQIVYPQNPADPWYQEFHGEVIPIYCTDFENDADLLAWNDELLAGEDREGANDWMHGVPQSTAGSGDPSEAFSGDRVVGNDLGGGDYNGMYQPDKRNVLISPSINVGKYENVHLQYRRWLNVEDGDFDQATIYANDTPVWTNLASGSEGDTHHEDKEWRFHSIDVSEQLYRGGVQIKYEIQTDAGLELGGWTIDDFCIVAFVEPEPEPVEEPTDGAGAGEGSDGMSGEEKGGCSSTGADGNLWMLLLVVGMMSLTRRRRVRVRI